ELLFGAIGVETKLNQTFTAGSGYTGLPREQSDPNAGSPGRHVTIDPEFRTVAATGSYAADGTLGGPRAWAAAIATYTAGCGNGTVEGSEQCDEGANNGTSGSCCNIDCACTDPAGNAGTICRASAGLCDAAESCTGTSTTCPADGFQPPTVECRASAGECDAQETCTGTGADCPPDAKAPAGTSCTFDGNPCTLDQCDGTSDACQHPAGNAGAVCRAAPGACDLTETCTGSSADC